MKKNSKLFVNIKEDGVKYNLTKIKEQDKIKRIGSDKSGHWDVINL